MSGECVVIRMAREGDFDRILSLLEEIAALHAEGRPDIFKGGAKKCDRSELEKLLTSPDSFIFVAEREGVVVGHLFAVLIEKPETPLLHAQKSLYIEDLCVSSACRRMGVGQKLLDAVKEAAKRLDCSNLTLNVWAFNQNAVAFYEKNGFAPQRMILENNL